MSKTSKSLFAAHYLEHRLRDHAAWQEDPSPTFAKLQALYNDGRHLLPNYNEAQTEKEFIQPTLEALGFAYTVQTSSKGQRPDYTLFADTGQKQSAEAFLHDEDAFYPRALAIAEAKYWERSLTVQHADTGRAQFDNRNPSFQIVNYLTGTGVDWGILTNGRYWRLYYRQAGSTATEFYEVDLVTLLEQGDLDDFKLFWLFFRQAAFIPDSNGRSFLDTVWQGSTAYARQISDQLKERVFHDVFPLLAGGFVADMARKGHNPDSDDHKALIYEATLSLLYKLLFLLYAEARDLLPLDHPGYQHESLRQLGQEIAGRLDRAEQLGETSTSYYRRLLALFELIDRGDPALGLPRYNGGLFHFDFAAPHAVQKHRANHFLRQYTINDGRLAQALDLLTRIEGERVDYSFLAVRHLGAVYEGLLEYQLHIEDAPAGRVRLSTNKGERKATGSYYTPDYIVKYIVGHTLDPILQVRAERFAALMGEIVPKRERWQELNARLTDTTTDLTPAVQSRYRNEAHILHQTLTSLERDARDTLLDIKLCDPAMGSGHFLVEAVDYLTDRLIAILNQHPDHNPILDQLEGVRRSILDNMAAQKIHLDAARLDDTQLLQRAVMKRCIYGVDLNRMAVELAKLSLWLHSFTIGAPLSFLDHHLRWGNSLVGASAREAEQALAAESGQMTLFGGPFKGLLRAAEVMRGISGLSDATLAEVEQSEALFREFDTAARSYKQLLDLRVAQHFGVPRAAEFLLLYGAEAIKAGADSVGAVYAETLHQTEQLFAQKRFFHWELEFPEVFVDLDKADWKTNPGFDAVVGNPPYDELSQDALGRPIDELVLFEANSYMKPAMGHRINLYRLFISQALSVLKSEGWHGFIVPLSLMADMFTFALRKHVLENFSLHRVEQFPQKDDPNDRVFYAAKLSTCLYILQKSLPTLNQIFIRTHHGREIVETSPSFMALQSDFADFDPSNLSIPGLNQNAWALVLKLAKGNTIKLGNYAKAVPGELMINRHFQPYLTTKSGGEEIIRGSHISMYEIVIPKQGKPLYLNRNKYLSGHQNSKKAFDHQNPRVVYQRYAAIDNYRRLIATILPEGFFCSHTVGYLADIQKYDPLFLLALLNSKLLDWRFNLTSTNNNINGYEVEALPIPVIDFSVSGTTRKEICKNLFYTFQENLLSDVDEIVDQVAHCLTSPNNQLAAVHDFLALCAEEMIAFKSEKQREVQGFLMWLGEYTETTVDTWTLKTIAQKYHTAGWDEFKRALFRNKTAIQQASGVDVQSRDALTRIKKEYEQSTAVLAPLLTRIQATDALIDQIVYQLYGLTDEEIVLIEESAPG